MYRFVRSAGRTAFALAVAAALSFGAREALAGAPAAQTTCAAPSIGACTGPGICALMCWYAVKYPNRICQNGCCYTAVRLRKRYVLGTLTAPATYAQCRAGTI